MTAEMEHCQIIDYSSAEYMYPQIDGAVVKEDDFVVVVIRD
jgi:hypothetical protein